jgi:hypothetical protein
MRNHQIHFYTTENENGCTFMNIFDISESDDMHTKFCSYVVGVHKNIKFCSTL